MFDEHDDFPVYEVSDIVVERHVHHLLQAQPFEFRRAVEVCAVQRVVQRQKVTFRIFVFAEEIDKHRILIPPIMLWHKISHKNFCRKLQLPKKFLAVRVSAYVQ